MAVYHVYILASASGVLYTGVTNYLERRVREHKQKLVEGFTKKYDVTRLVYFEPHGQRKSAISREKQIKSWRREKKLALIRSMNPKFRDLSEDFPRGWGEGSLLALKGRLIPQCCPGPSTTQPDALDFSAGKKSGRSARDDREERREERRRPNSSLVLRARSRPYGRE